MLEEFSELIELPISGRLPIFPSTISVREFLRLLGLHIFLSLRNVEGGKVKLDYLFRRFS